MPLLKALKNEEKKDHQGWSNSNMFPINTSTSVEDTINDWPSQHIVAENEMSCDSHSTETPILVQDFSQEESGQSVPVIQQQADMSPSTSNNATVRLLLNEEGDLTLMNGKPVPCTPEQKEKVLASNQYLKAHGTVNAGGGNIKGRGGKVSAVGGSVHAASGHVNAAVPTVQKVNAVIGNVGAAAISQLSSKSANQTNVNSQDNALNINNNGPALVGVQQTMSVLGNNASVPQVAGQHDVQYSTLPVTQVQGQKKMTVIAQGSSPNGTTQAINVQQILTPLKTANTTSQAAPQTRQVLIPQINNSAAGSSEQKFYIMRNIDGKNVYQAFRPQSSGQKSGPLQLTPVETRPKIQPRGILPKTRSKLQQEKKLVPQVKSNHTPAVVRANSYYRPDSPDTSKMTEQNKNRDEMQTEDGNIKNPVAKAVEEANVNHEKIMVQSSPVKSMCPSQNQQLATKIDTVAHSPEHYRFANLTGDKNQTFEKYGSNRYVNLAVTTHVNTSPAKVCYLIANPGASLQTVPANSVTLTNVPIQNSSQNNLNQAYVTYQTSPARQHQQNVSVISTSPNKVLPVQATSLLNQNTVKHTQVSSVISQNSVGDTTSSQPMVGTVLCSYSDPTIDISQLQGFTPTSSPQVSSSQNSVITLEVQSESETTNQTTDSESSDPLSSISPENTEVINNQKWKKNTVYQIPINDKDYYYVFDGEKLLPYNLENNISGTESNLQLSSDIPQSPEAKTLVGGGLGDKKLKGNATGLNLLQGSSQPFSRTSVRELLTKPLPRVIPMSAAGSKPSSGNPPNVQNGRVWKHSGGPQDNLTRRPIHVNSAPMKDGSTQVEGSTKSQKAELSTTRQGGSTEKLVPLKRPPDENPDFESVVHCRFCGYTSSNIDECDRCGRVFGANVRIQQVKRKKTTDVKSSDKDTAISKQSFYGQKLNEQSAPYQSGRETASSKTRRGFGRPITVQGNTYRTPNRKLVRVKSIVPPEPVTVILSSDDEDESSQPPTPKDQPPVSTSVTTATAVTTPGTVVTVSMDTVANKSCDDLSELVNVLPNKRANSPTFPGSRIHRMENEKGKVILKNKSDKPPSRPSSRAEESLPEDPIPASVKTKSSREEEKEESEENLPSSITIKANKIQIGSLKGIPIDPVTFTSDGVELYIECEEDTFRISIEQNDLKQIYIYLENHQLMLLRTTSEFGKRMRLKLGMQEKKEGKPHFDPDDKEERHQFIIITISSLNGHTSSQVTKFLQKYANPSKNPQTDFLYTLKDMECQALLNKILLPSSQTTISSESSSGEVTPVQKDMERSPSPPRILFSGHVVRLITFPPPPAKGGMPVTNEDLFCLQEGEFLNDVIIDFYLKYLFLKVLSEEDRERTHIFSSFFFKRLTLRQGRGSSAETPDMTPAEKKHARVKTWTKHVDLFEKDFIIVPINEHSHWFLAIICFPGMTGMQRTKYVPRAKVPCVEEKPAQKTVLKSVVNSPLAVGDAKQYFEPCKLRKGYKIPKKGEKSSKSETEMEVDEENRKEEESSESTGKSEEGRKEEENAEAMETDEQDEKEEESEEGEQKTEGETEKAEEKKMEVDEQAATAATPLPTGKSTGKEIFGQLATEEDMNNPNLKIYVGQRLPCILVLDSLAGQSRSRITNILKEYLQVEWDVKKKTPNNLKEKVRGSSPKCPQQTNYSDCGIYVLQYVESFFEDPIQDFTIPMKPLTSWFTNEKVSKKRQEIENIVMRLKEEQEGKVS